MMMSFFILTASVGLFFYSFFETPVYAQKNDMRISIAPEMVDPLNRIGKGVIMKDDSIEASCEDAVVAKKESIADKPRIEKRVDVTTEVSLDIIDPLNKIGKGIVAGEDAKNNPKIAAMLEGSPMEAMVEALNGRNGEVASYLIAIAKKESDWGKHSPKKSGQECYNYWGYRGKENPTDSGYSCFDSPSHAITVVGDRIEKLIDSKVNTPAKMVIWKCGSNCEAAGGQAAADKWITDVASYYNKLKG